LDFASTPTAQA